MAEREGRPKRTRERRSEEPVEAKEHRDTPFLRVLTEIPSEQWKSTNLSGTVTMSVGDGLFGEDRRGFTTTLDTSEGSLAVNFEQLTRRKTSDELGAGRHEHRICVYVPGEEEHVKILPIPKEMGAGSSPTPQEKAETAMTNNFRAEALGLYSRLSAEVPVIERQRAAETIGVVEARIAAAVPPTPKS